MNLLPIQYETFVQQTPAPVVVIDESMRIVEMNPTFSVLFNIVQGDQDHYLTDFIFFRNIHFLSIVSNGFNEDKPVEKNCSFELKEQFITLSVKVFPSGSDEQTKLAGLVFHEQVPENNSKDKTSTLESEENIVTQNVMILKIVHNGIGFEIVHAVGSLLSKLGIPVFDIENKMIHELYLLDDTDKYLLMLNRVWNLQREETYEGKVFGLDFIASVVPILKRGLTIEIICTVTDISLMKKTKRELFRNQQKYQSLMYDNSDNIFLIDRNCKIAEINPAAEKRMKMKPNSLIGRDYRDFIKPESLELTNAHFKKAMNGESQYHETIILNEDLSESHISCAMFPIFIDGKVEGVYGVGRDVTALVRMDRKLKKTTTLLQAYFNHTNDGASLVAQNGMLLTVNHRFADMFGWEKDDLEGQHINSLLHHEQPLSHKQQIEQALKGNDIKQFESVLSHKDGRELSVLINLSAIRSEQDVIIGIALIIQDLSNRKLTENLLKKSEQLALIGQLAAGVAHEIRNPLTTLKGFLQLMAEEQRDSPYIEILQKELNRIEFITGELLTLAKPQVTAFKQMSLDEIIYDSVQFISMEAVKHAVDIELVTEKIDISCEGHQLKQVFLNLFMNAIEAMPNGGNLTVVLKKVNQTARILITDTGIGIEESRLRKLGEPFYSTKEKGTGLGLMICRNIIESHEGTFEIQSGVGVGTSVSITLPILNR
ncbi:PAS domain S-box protein [Jeotgalibacillus sp. S-D1]|uniref:PAS domain S-box protein n=1 Tax=Jeotgalibacillus sp. S-D1 TaxID=2552189 RepID=UPI00105A704B|nr:PAS domain S-box protein [Jeotgalibacillus sp. S-D1]TDL30680.1 PAS domain S-box protein [Jeotgalibacillus sp. S-D1]